GTHPTMVVARAAQRLDSRSPDGVEAHAHRGGVHVRFEYRDLHGLRERLERFDLLARFHRPDVDVAGADRDRPLAELRLLTLRVELERDLEMTGRVLPVGVHVHVGEANA